MGVLGTTLKLAAVFVNFRQALVAAQADLLAFFYHNVSDHSLPHVRHLYPYKSTNQFERDLDFLTRNFKPLSLEDVVATLTTGSGMPRRSFLLTFDDGLREAAEPIAPILKRRGIPAMFFVNSDFVDNKRLFYLHKASLIVDRLISAKSDNVSAAASSVLAAYGLASGKPVLTVRRLGYKDESVLNEIANAIEVDFEDFLASRRPYLDSAELDAMAADGFAIGAHSRSHPNYQEIPVESQLRETLDSIEFVRKRWNPTHLAFAFPFNDLDVPVTVFDAMWEAGVEVSFGTSGLRRDTVPRSIQRIWADDPNASMEQVITTACLRAIARRFIGKGVIRRS